jgi:hypothetical protein
MAQKHLGLLARQSSLKPRALVLRRRGQIET